MRTRARRDIDEPLFRAAFEAHGCSYQPLSQKGLPDAIVAWPNAAGTLQRMALTEHKTGTAKLRPVQEVFHRRFCVWTVRSLKDVNRVVAWLKS